MIENNVKVLISRVILSTGETLHTHLNHIAEVWIGWLVSRGVVDNLTEEILQLYFNQNINISVSLLIINTVVAFVSDGFSVVLGNLSGWNGLYN